MKRWAAVMIRIIWIALDRVRRRAAPSGHDIRDAFVDVPFVIMIVPGKDQQST